MKLIHKYLILGVAAAGAFTACDNYDADDHKFDNVVYLDVSKTDEVQPATSATIRPRSKSRFRRRWPIPKGRMSRFRSRWIRRSWRPTTPATVRTGKCSTRSITSCVRQRDHPCRQDRVGGGDAPPERLMGEGEQQTGALPIDETYLLPVRISHSSCRC